MIGEAAMAALPAGLPGFLRTRQASVDVGELSREPDRSKGAGKIHDSDRDPGHFLDLDDDGKVMGGPPLAALPVSRADYEAELRSVGTDSWQAGYLPYSIVGQQQQLAKDLAYWRVLSAAEAREAAGPRRVWLSADRRRREALILVDIGGLSHFVGDGSQPLHVTLHFNGWGDRPNPEGFTRARVHGPFEEAFAAANVTPADLRAGMAPPADCRCPVEPRVAAYLAATALQVGPFYRLEKAGGFVDGDPRGRAFAAARLAAGASELRDLIVQAWRASAYGSVGWPAVKVEDAVAGKVDAYPALYGKD